MPFLVYDLEKSIIGSKSSSKNYINEEENEIEIADDDIIVDLIGRNREPQVLKKRKFNLKFSMILLIQFIFISFLSWLGFFYKLNEIFIKNNIIMIIKIEIAPFLILLIIISIISKEICNKFRESLYLIIYHIFFVVCAVYFIFLQSKYCEYKYIFTSLGLILSELLAMISYLLLFKNINMDF